MIFVQNNLLSPRDTEVVAIASTDHKRYLYMDLDTVEILFSYGKNDMPFELSKEALLGNANVPAKSMELAMMIVSNFDKSWIQAVAAYLLLIPEKYIPTFETEDDKMLFACMALDTILSSVNIEAYVKYKEVNRPDLTSTFRMLKHYKSRAEQIFGMWFTGVVVTPITNVQYVSEGNNTPIQQTTTTTTTTESTKSAKVKQPVGGIADMIQETSESPDTISEEEYAALMAELSALDESYEQIKAEEAEDKNGNKVIKVDPEVKRRNDAANAISSLLRKF